MHSSDGQGMVRSEIDLDSNVDPMMPAEMAEFKQSGCHGVPAMSATPSKLAAVDGEESKALGCEVTVLVDGAKG